MLYFGEKYTGQLVIYEKKWGLERKTIIVIFIFLSYFYKKIML